MTLKVRTRSAEFVEERKAVCDCSYANSYRPSAKADSAAATVLAGDGNAAPVKIVAANAIITMLATRFCMGDIVT